MSNRELALELFEQGYSGAEIGRRLGISRERVRQLVDLAGKNLRSAGAERTQRKRELIHKYAASGLTGVEIAKIFGPYSVAVAAGHHAAICDLCADTFTRATNSSLCPTCRNKYKSGKGTFYWNMFKYLSRTFPEFVPAINRILASDATRKRSAA